MTSQRRTALIAAACLVLCAAASVLTLRRVDQLRPRATLEDVLYISSPKVVKRASLGYDGLMACIYWTRAVQYFGQRYHDRFPELQRTRTAAGDHDATRSAPDRGLPVRRQFSCAPPAVRRGPTRARHSVDGIRHSEQSRGMESLLRPGLCLLHGSQRLPKAADAFARGSRVPARIRSCDSWPHRWRNTPANSTLRA